jgi:predicted RNase H-like nuclease (RuvC/YqgF family)
MNIENKNIIDELQYTIQKNVFIINNYKKKNKTIEEELEIYKNKVKLLSEENKKLQEEHSNKIEELNLEIIDLKFKVEYLKNDNEEKDSIISIFEKGHSKVMSLLEYYENHIIKIIKKRVKDDFIYQMWKKL